MRHPETSEQSMEAEWLHRFQTQIRPDLLAALVRHDAEVAKRGKFFTSVAYERADGAREVAFRVGRAGVHHEILLTYKGAGQVSVETGSGTPKVFTVTELDQKAIDRIATEWLGSLEL